MRRFSRVLKKVAKVCSPLNSIQYVFINYDFIFHFDGAIMHSSFAARDAYSVCEFKQQQAWRQKRVLSLENDRNQKWYTKNERLESERAQKKWKQFICTKLWSLVVPSLDDFEMREHFAWASVSVT